MTILKTERLTLRPLRISDLQAVYRYASDAENTRYMMFYPHESLLETKRFLQNAELEWRKASPAYYEFAVLLGNAQIGGMTLYMNEARTEGEFSWLIDRNYQRKGFAAEAVHAIIGFAQETLRIHSFIAQCDYRNAPSIALMERLGMTPADKDGERTYPKTGEIAGEYTYRLLTSSENGIL